MTTIVPVKQDTKENGGKLAKRAPFYNLQEEMNRLFDEFRHGIGFHRPQWLEPMTDFDAKVDMKDTDKEVIITAELPGVEMKDIEVSLQEHAVIIKGEKRFEKEEKDKNYYRMERSYGSFSRVLPLPCSIDRDAVEA